MKRMAFKAALICAARASCMAPALAGKRVVLAIGNNADKYVPTVNDARTVGDMLKQRGFNVMAAENLNR